MTSALALELNDCGLRVAGDPALDELEPSPGWAVFEPEGEEIRVGRQAAERMRLNPRLAHRALWSELDLTPLPKPYPRGLSTADLAYTHLGSIWESVERRLGKGDSAGGARLLVAPGSYTPEQLGLVLGIAQSLDRPFTGVVDSAVAAAATRTAEPVAVLDLELGRTVGSEIGAADGTLFRRRVLTQKSVGWNGLVDRWARAIGRAFVKTTRFDPLHTAPSEQSLYGLLPDWLAALCERDSTEAVMRAGGREHAIVLTRDEFVAAVEPLYGAIVELASGVSGGGRLLVTDRLRRAPGLIDRLDDPIVLPAGAALDGALRHAALIHQPSEPVLRWVTELPVADPAGVAAATSPRA